MRHVNILDVQCVLSTIFSYFMLVDIVYGKEKDKEEEMWQSPVVSDDIGSDKKRMSQ